MTEKETIRDLREQLRSAQIERARLFRVLILAVHSAGDLLAIEPRHMLDARDLVLEHCEDPSTGAVILKTRRAEVAK